MKEKSMTGKEIAKRVGKESALTRSALEELCREGLLEKRGNSFLVSRRS
jgi:predicted transcriptional regulator